MKELTLNHLERAAQALVRDGQYEIANDFYELALQHDANNPTLLLQSSGVLRLLKRPRDAEWAARWALESGETTERLIAFSATLRDQKKSEQAVRVLRRALELDPDSSDAKGYLAASLNELWLAPDGDDALLTESLALAEQAIQVQPNNPNFHAARHGSLLFQGQPHAVLHYADALVDELDEPPHEFLLARAFSALKLGDFRQGMPWLAACVNRPPDFDRRDIDAIPAWHPGDKPGPVVCWRRDGAGDLFQCARYFRLAAEHGAELHVIAADSQARLIARCPGVAGVLGCGDAKAERLTTIWDLAAFFTANESDIPPAPYLSVDPESIERWGRRLHGIPGLKVGICWRGNPYLQNERRRSVPVAAMVPLFRMPGISLISLQKECDDLDPAIHDLGLNYQQGDWLDTAAVIQNLDLVISPDTGIAHLAGALGKPCWIALPEPSEWRWLMDRDDSPWYSSVRLFRQTTRGHWGDVFVRMAEALRLIV